MLFERLDEPRALTLEIWKKSTKMTVDRTVFYNLFDQSAPPGSGRTMCSFAVSLRKISKITISGIAVLAFVELRDRVWEGCGLF